MEQITLTNAEEAYTNAVYDLVQAIIKTDTEATRMMGDYIRSFLSGHPDGELEEALIIKKTALINAHIQRLTN